MTGLMKLRVIYLMEMVIAKLNYDSENGMFCVYTNDIRIADEVAYKLSNLYKDENKMIELIKETKEKYGYIFDVHI